MSRLDFKPVTDFKPFNWNISWSAGFKTDLVTRSQKAGLCWCWMAYRFVHVVNSLSRVPIKATGKKLRIWEQGYSQFFFILVLALLVSLASEAQPNASADQF